MLVSILPDGLILEADDTAGAEVLLHKSHPQLVVIDGDLPGNPKMQLVQAIQAARPHIRCAILANDVLQQAAATKAGAEEASIKGDRPARLFTGVEQLLRLQ